MTITPDNPHYDRYPWGNAVYWQNGAACGKLDAWDECEIVTTRGITMGRIKNKSQGYGDQDVRILLSGLRDAFNSGKDARSKEFRDLLMDSRK